HRGGKERMYGNVIARSRSVGLPGLSGRAGFSPGLRRMAAVGGLLCGGMMAFAAFGGGGGGQGSPHPTLSAQFTRKVLTPPGEAPFNLRFFSTAVKTDSRGRIITGLTSDPTKRLVGAEAAGERGGQMSYTKIMFGADYFNGKPDPGTRIDPNDPM